jgi:hypothetical protein
MSLSAQSPLSSGCVTEFLIAKAVRGGQLFVCSTSQFCYQKEVGSDAGRELKSRSCRSLAAPHRELQKTLTANLKMDLQSKLHVARSLGAVNLTEV